MRAQISWYPLVSLRTVYRWSAGRELFYQTAAKAVAVDRIVSALALTALVAGVVCIATRPLTAAGPVWGLLLIVAPMAWRHARGRTLLYGCVAIGILATYRSLSAPLIGLVVANLLAAVLILIERRLHQQWMFKPLYLGNTNVGTARLLRGHVEIAHLFLEARPPRRTRSNPGDDEESHVCMPLAGEGGAALWRAGRFYSPATRGRGWLLGRGGS